MISDFLPLVPSLHPTPLFLIGLTVLGGGVGYASGLFGVGGGFIVTPLLITIFGMNVAYAVGAEVTQMIAVGISATRRHAIAGFVDMRMGFYMAPSIIVGTFAGKWALDYLKGLGNLTIQGQPVPVITLTVSGTFVILLSIIGVYLWRANESPLAEQRGGPLCWQNGPLTISLPDSGIPKCSLVSIACCGVLLGFLAGMLGIGGGVLLVPLLILGFGLPLRMAIGTGPLLILFSAFFSTINHAVAGNVDLRIVFALLVGSTFGVQIGAWHSHRLHLVHLRRSFAILVMAVVLIVLFRLLGYFFPFGRIFQG